MDSRNLEIYKSRIDGYVNLEIQKSRNQKSIKLNGYKFVISRIYNSRNLEIYRSINLGIYKSGNRDI